VTLNPVATPDGRGVTWVELFFDLIFVFSVTQLVGLLHDGFTWLAVGQFAMAFWFVWFAWGQFTWALNAANTRHSKVQQFTLAAGAVAFCMAVAIPDAFHSRSLFFAITYVGVRVWASRYLLSLPGMTRTRSKRSRGSPYSLCRDWCWWGSWWRWTVLGVGCGYRG